MKKKLLLVSTLAFILFSCSKSVETVATDPKIEDIKTPIFSLYTIAKGSQYCDQTALTAANYSELKFIVKFDSTAIYTNLNPENQGDINKLYGFSDNDSLHHLFSARFGWNWQNNALKLYAYIYNDGIRSSSLLGDVAIGQEHQCSIKVNGSSYIFTLNGKQTIMPRTSKTPTGRGYKLFPYFGGNEFAPHLINILIEEL